jgi:hypothetical protein
LNANYFIFYFFYHLFSITDLIISNCSIVRSAEALPHILG